METRRIKLTDLVLNEGQIAGLPTNPRQWTKTELNKLKKSLQERPNSLRQEESSFILGRANTWF